MSIFEAIILGIIQGLTEFLPISSTGHLTLAGRLMNLISDTEPEKWTSFIAVIQMGTLFAVLIYFYKDLMGISGEFLKENLSARKRFSEQSLNSKMGWYIILGTVPVVVIGLLFKDFIEGAFTKNLIVISLSLIVLGVILSAAEKLGSFKKNMNDLKWYDSLVVGLAQAISLIPGSSRSGTTITAGLFLGFTRETAARFSFLLSIPAVLASGLLQFYESLEFLNAAMTINLIASTIAAAISGYLAIDFLLKFLRRNSTYVFVFYRIILGLFVLGLIWFNYINP